MNLNFREQMISLTFRVLLPHFRFSLKLCALIDDKIGYAATKVIWCSGIFEIHRSRRRERMPSLEKWPIDFLFFCTRPIHSSEIRSLLSMKCSYEMPRILIVYLMYHADVFYFFCEWIIPEAFHWNNLIEHKPIISEEWPST